ncbi:MAG: hypoxanthine phosphoribosyltransferase [Bellilinea sp.]
MKSNQLAGYDEFAGDIQEIIITEEQIQDRVREIGAQISEDYRSKCPVLVGVLKGVLFFMADLLRVIRIPTEVDFLAVSSYSSEARNKGVVRLVKDLELPINHRHVIFVEDVIDTGLTLNYLLRSLREREPESLEVCVLFNKPERRLIEIPLKYKGFDLPNRFVVGYGLDHQERYRNLPFIGLLTADAFSNPNHLRECDERH